MTTPAPEPVEVAAGELAAAEHWLREGLIIGNGERMRDVLMAEYDRRAECLRFLNEKYDIRREQQQWQDETATKLRAALARALPVVEAAGAVVSWCAENNDEVPERLLDALARAVRAAREPRTGEGT